jgi:hypothetical protein
VKRSHSEGRLIHPRLNANKHTMLTITVASQELELEFPSSPQQYLGQLISKVNNVSFVLLALTGTKEML